MRSNTTGRVVNGLRGQIVASEVAAVTSAAETLFQEVGQHLLSETSRQTLRSAAEEGATQMLEHAAPGLLTQAAGGAAKTLPKAVSSAGRDLARATSREVVKAASKEVLKGAGRAAGLGFVLDGAVAAVEAVHGYQTGQLNGGEACTHVVREASTGAVASGGGVLVAAGLVALTGGTAALPLAAVAVGSSIGIKLGLKSLFG